MECDFCDAKATVFFTQVSNGAMKKVALCEACAEERGVNNPNGLLMADQLLGSVSGPASVSEPEVFGNLGAAICESCGFSTEDYQKVGRLGCSVCYTTFAEEIAERLPQLHKGASHSGRVPEGLLQIEQLREQLKSLESELEQAINTENYEQAAKLRDQIQKLTQNQEGGEAVTS